MTARRPIHPTVFERPHHQRIASVLQGLHGELLRTHACSFGGGTAIALRYGELRESVGIDFLMSDLAHYRQLRLLATGPSGFAALARGGVAPWAAAQPVRADQYGIRGHVVVVGQPIKLEIVLEARIALQPARTADDVCGVPSLTALDLAASKLLANADRWLDDVVFSRDVIDLAMMRLRLPMLREALSKAEQAYGPAVRRDLGRAIDRLAERTGWLERCMQAMAIRVPKALLWQRIRALRRVL